MEKQSDRAHYFACAEDINSEIMLTNSDVDIRFFFKSKKNKQTALNKPCRGQEKKINPVFCMSRG